MIRLNKRKKNKRPKKTRPRTSAIPRSLMIDFREMQITASTSLYLRTGNVQYSFSPSSQQPYVNLATLLNSSSQWNNSVVIGGGGMSFEYCMVPRIRISWMPEALQFTQNTFELTSFLMRYFGSAFDLSPFDAGMTTEFQPAHMKCLVQQTNRPQTVQLDLPSSYIPNSGVFQLGCFATVDQYQSSTISGILTAITTSSATNSVSSYNPRVGIFEITYVVRLFNSVP